MTLGELRRLVLATDQYDDNLEVKVWLPGSTVRLSGRIFRSTLTKFRGLLIEGNLDEGSALS